MLSPVEQCVLPNQSEYTFTCETNTGILIWREGSNQLQINCTTILSGLKETEQLGIFTVGLTRISGNNLTSTATVNTSSLFNTSLSITCGDNDIEVEALLINGVYVVPVTRTLKIKMQPL